MKAWTLVLIVAYAVLMLAVEQVPAQSESGKAADCSTYARNRAESETSTGGGALRGGLIGGAGGAAFGAIVGGSKGAKRGAALGGGVGAISGGVGSSRDREALYQRYYDACMRGETR